MNHLKVASATFPKLFCAFVSLSHLESFVDRLGVRRVVQAGWELQNGSMGILNYGALPAEFVKWGRIGQTCPMHGNMRLPK